jgi:hypothetical protein
VPNNDINLGYPEHPGYIELVGLNTVTNQRLRLAATTSIQQRSSNNPARSPVRHRDRPDPSLVDPKENVSKQGKVSQHSRAVRPVPCIDPAHLPNPDSCRYDSRHSPPTGTTGATKHYPTTSPILLPHLGC